MKKIMKLEMILAGNLNQLMADTPGLNTVDQVAQRSGVGRGTVDRVRKAEVSTKIETVDLLATAFGVSPLALLSENMSFATNEAPVTESAVASSTAALKNSTPTSMQWVSPDESGLLSDYRTTDDDGRRTVRNIASMVPKVVSLAIFGNDKTE